MRKTSDALGILAAVMPGPFLGFFRPAVGWILIIMRMHPLADEWLPVLIAPPDADLEVCVMDYDGIIHALAFPCHKNKTGWFDALTKKRIDIQPTHWRKWTDNH